MTSSQPEAEAPEEGAAPAEETPHPLEEYARAVAEAVGGEPGVQFDTVKVTVDADDWVSALTTARDDFDLVLFSFLSAIDWANDTAVGEPLDEPLEEESFEVIATVADVTEGRRVTFSARIPHDQPAIASLIDVYAGADWHEREANEMFGIDFIGHPDLSNLYLPEGFLGNPLRKSFPLLSREVKPWPGKVDVEAMPEDEDEEEEEGEEAEGSEAASEEEPEGSSEGESEEEPEEGQ
ncbi:MAG: NADH-quinone oxidoreductase subunit C [Actinomycetota bacterium]